ncbi:MAG: sigma-70 family RNA polymerase sigma factor [Clostridia bacterium]|nr:sigma-70 family RNA polymerase sigma factor [Oscillospiraceae bacterium]MBR2411312.1 sigma-70 family RNA polymerase sigma factor [Clostridia bacterium]
MSGNSNNTLVTENLGLVHSCANRFRGRGVDYDDLFQAGCVGLIKAAAGFDETLGFRFSTYAVPAILGEIKRIFRDGGTVKVGRAAKEKARQLFTIKEELSRELGKEPSVSEIAKKADMEISEAASLLCACLPVISLTAEDDEGQTDIPVSSPEEIISRRIDLDRALSTLESTEKQLIELRYFGGLTQSVTAEKLGMSQVQVSRKEKAILLKLRKLLA